MSFCSCCAGSLLCQLLSTPLLSLLMFVTCFASLSAMGPLASVWRGLWILSRRWCSRTRTAIAEVRTVFLTCACASAPRAVWFLAQQPWFSIVSLREISFGNVIYDFKKESKEHTTSLPTGAEADTPNHQLASCLLSVNKLSEIVHRHTHSHADKFTGLSLPFHHGAKICKAI